VAGIKAQFPAITFSKTVLSEFESGRRNLTSLVQRALRDYFEAQGHEFSDVPDAANEAQPPQAGEQVRVVRDAVVVCDRLSHSERGALQDRIGGLLQELQSDGKTKATEGFIDPYDDETDLKRDQSIAKFAEVGLLYSILFRQCPIGAPSEVILKNPRAAKNIAEVLAVHFSQTFKLITTDNRGELNGVGASDGGHNDSALDGDEGKATTSTANLDPEVKKDMWGHAL